MTGSRPAGLSLDDGHATWDVLSERLETLIRRWDAGEVPRLAEFVPDGAPALRRLILTELIKVDVDYRWNRGLPRRIEEYLADFPELAAAGVPCDLIFEEYQVRRRAGEAVTAGEYVKRFPDRAQELRRLLGGPESRAARGRPGGPSDVEAGQVLDDFDLLALVGEGAFARVFLARQKSLSRLVALKVSADYGAETQTLAQLDHPHIVRVYDQRVLPDRGLRLLYMPYLPGGTLKEVLEHVRETPANQRSGRLLVESVDAALARRGEVPPTDSANREHLAAMSWPETVCWLGARLADALDHAHKLGVLHHDLKPANVLLGADAAPRLADFNVSSCSKVEGAGPGAFFGGSLAYMSPEQIEAFDPSHERAPESLDGRADIYSLALTLWELLTGARPFPDEGVQADWQLTLALLVERRNKGLDDEALTQLPPDMPPGLFDVLRTCLEPDPGRRYATAGELARQLDLCRKPRTRELLVPRPGWRKWVRRHPLLSIYTVGLIPNLIAAWFNIEYNREALIKPYPAAEGMFKLLQLFVNATFFPLCVGLFTIFLWPVARGLRQLQRGSLPAADLGRLRRRCLNLGPASVLVTLWAWVVAGIIFPVALHFSVHELPAAFHLHFLASQTLCGLIAVTYPQFGITFLALRAIYPAFLPNATLHAEDVSQLQSMDRSQGWYLVLAASVPMLAVGLLAGIGGEIRVVLGTLSIIGVAGFAVAYLLVTAIRADRAALEDLTRS
ncbi:MAG TPA: serine/threonine-protein kinase [Gemmataceae bacterium]|nr:serine/threonine-protein kinase [Gemmataceae bacterium]